MTASLNALVSAGANGFDQIRPEPNPHNSFRGPSRRAKTEGGQAFAVADYFAAATMGPVGANWRETSRQTSRKSTIPTP